MNQTLSVELSIPIPEDSILIKKTEYKALQDAVNKGKWETLDWFKELTGIYNLVKLKEEILYKFKDELDVENGGFIFYPEAGQSYKILKSKAVEWTEQNFERTFKRS